MTHLWRLLCGDVPGGLGLLLTCLLAFWVIWEFVYRAGETLPVATYRKWRMFGPVIIIVIYAILWIQSPAKLEPSRIAILSGEKNSPSWQNRAVVDLTARSLRNTLEYSLVNPWDGAVNYPPPDKAAAERAGYRVFVVETAQATMEEIRTNATALVNQVISDAGKKNSPVSAFQGGDQILEPYYRGLVELEAGSIGSAQLLFETVLESDSAFYPAKIALARCLELSGDRAGAKRLLTEATRSTEGSEEVLLALGEFFLRDYEWDGVESALKVVLAKNHLQARAMVGLTRIHPDRLKDLRFNTPSALAEEAVRLDPLNESARIAWVDQLLPKGYIADARKVLEQGLNISPNSPELLLKLAALEIQAGNPEEALAIYVGMLQKDPDNAIVVFNLGAVQYHAKEYDEALKTFRRVEALNGPVDYLYYLGMIYKIKGQLNEARYYFQQRWERRTGNNDLYGQRAAQIVANIDQSKNSGR